MFLSRCSIVSPRKLSDKSLQLRVLYILWSPIQFGKNCMTDELIHAKEARPGIAGGRGSEHLYNES